MANRHAMGSCDRTDWVTPDWLFNRLLTEFEFGLDAAATEQSKKVSLYYGPDHELRICRDALCRDWDTIPTDGGYVQIRSVWLNPPYGKDVGDWVRKAYQQSRRGLTVVVLANSQTDTLWFRDFVQRADEVRFCTGRISFVDPDTGLPAKQSVNRSMIVVFRPHHDGPPRYSVVDYRPGMDGSQLSILGGSNDAEEA